MNISNNTGVSNTNAASQIQKLAQKPIQKEIAADAPKQLPVSDRVELSGMSELMKSLKAGKDFRADKVESVKAQIAAGTYETDDKLDITADRLLDDLTK